MPETVTLTNMCMILDGDRVLVQDRRDPAWPGITFPGGHVEEGEAFTDAVIREVWEETGLTVASPRLVGVKDWFSAGKRYVVLLYSTDRFTGKLIAAVIEFIIRMSLDLMESNIMHGRKA